MAKPVPTTPHLVRRAMEVLARASAAARSATAASAAASKSSFIRVDSVTGMLPPSRWVKATLGPLFTLFRVSIILANS